MNEDTDLRSVLDGVSRRAVPERDRVAAVRARSQRLHTRRLLASTATATSVVAVAALVGVSALRSDPPGRDRVVAASTGATATTSASAAPSVSCPPGTDPSESVTHLRTAGGYPDPESAARASGLAGAFERTGIAPRVVLAQRDSAGRPVATYEVTEVSAGSWGVSTIRKPAGCVPAVAGDESATPPAP
jgi:hypothetical protein